MSSALTNQTTTPRTPTPPQAPRAGRRRRLIAVVCLLLGVSAGVRYWRDLQFLQLEKQSKNAPFPLKNLPMVLGSWRALEGVETVLDPEIARIAGSSDHVLRTYVNDETGDRASVLVLYGLATLVWGHTPEVCYPSVGFQPLSNPRDVPIALEDGESVPFREALYGKSLAGATSYHEVYYSFRNAGEWRTEMASRWKRFRNYPGMFKVQVERRVKSAATDDDACRDLLAALAEEIEKRSSSPSISVASTKAAAE